MTAPRALYIHIPFCTHICGYCDFSKVIYNKQWALSYQRALFDELDAYQIKKVDTVYIGGGTPTSLDDRLFEELLAKAASYLDNGGEFTVEANPESLNSEKLVLMKRYGVSRLSIGLESADRNLLKAMGRQHTYADVQAAIANARRMGFDNINVDLIYALPGEDDETLERDLQATLILKTEHISAYSFILGEGTAFSAHGYKEADEDTQARQYEQILRELRSHGYDRYEVSNFCRNGEKSRHNLVYWKDNQYFAAGLGASGYIGSRRYTNTRNLANYLAGKRSDYEETVSPEDDLKYFFMTNLRLEDGFLESDFKDRFSFSFWDRYSKQTEKLVKSGLLVVDEGRVKASDRGILLLDRILLELY